MIDHDQQAPAASEIADPRYLVEKVSDGRGYAIIDTTGKDQPYIINAMRSLTYYERLQLTQKAIERYEEHNKKVAEEWAYTWNIVALGYCGACKTRVAEGEGHAAVGFYSLDRRICFYCASSQED